MAVMLLEWVFTSAFLILVVLALRAALGRRMSAGLRYALWAVVLVRLLVPVQLFTSPVAGAWAVTEKRTGHTVYTPAEPSVTHAGAEDVTAPPAVNAAQGNALTAPSAPKAPTVPEAPEPPDLNNLPGWVGCLGWAWLAGAAAAAFVLLLSNLRFAWRLRQERIPLEAANCPLRVYVATGLPSPCLFGIVRPAVYVTPEAAADPDMLRHVLAHEYTHFRHGDHIWSLLRCAALAAHWWDPLVWLAAVLSQRDAELACDEGALKRLGDGERAGYGATLLALVTARPGAGDLFRCATTMAGDKKSLRERISRIAKAPQRVVWAIVVTVLVTALACLCAFGQADPDAADEPDPTPSQDPAASEEPWRSLDFSGGELIYDQDWGDGSTEKLVELPEYPGVVFHCTSGTVTAVAEDGEQALYSGMPVWNVYLCDLTGDGRRELCSCVSFGSGLIDERIQVYDYAEQTLYVLEDRGMYDYSLRLEGERLWAEERYYHTGGQQGVSGTVRRAGPLVLTSRGLNIQQADQMDSSECPQADLNRNGVPETLQLASLDSGSGQRLEVWENGEMIWSDEGYFAHAGYNALFLYRDSGGDYLLRYNPYNGQGWMTYSYKLFTLSETGEEQAVRENSIEFDINFHPLMHQSFDPEAIAAFIDEINALLANSVQLMNTDGELLDAFEKEGRLYDSVGWLDTWEPVFTRDPSKPLLENLRSYQASREMEWYAEEPTLFVMNETEENAHVWLSYQGRNTQFDVDCWEWEFQPEESVDIQVVDLNRDGKDEIVFPLVWGHGTGAYVEKLYVFDAETLEQYDTSGLNDMVVDSIRSTGDEENFYLSGLGLAVTIPKREARENNPDVPLADKIGLEEIIRYTVTDGTVCCWLGCDASGALLNYIGYVQAPVQMTPSGVFACGRAQYTTDAPFE